VAPLLQRLLILRGLTGPDHLQDARHRALFLLLREIRTGWLTLTDSAQRSILQEAQASQDWLVRQEVDAALTIGDDDAPSGFPSRVCLRRTAYRRLRGQRRLQVALDMHDLDEATTIAIAAAEAGRRLGVPIMLDAGQHRACRQWVRDMEHAGIDGLTVTTNIDPACAARAIVELVRNDHRTAR
jgi:hypothetical protein